MDFFSFSLLFRGEDRTETNASTFAQSVHSIHNSTVNVTLKYLTSTKAFEAPQQACVSVIQFLGVFDKCVQISNGLYCVP